MTCGVCRLDRLLCERPDCPFLQALGGFASPFLPPTSPILWPVVSQPIVPLPTAPVLDKAPEDAWYSDDVVNLLFKHYVAQAGNKVSTVPAVLGSRNALGINFLETYLTHHLLDHPGDRRPIAIPVNLGNRHWIGLFVQFEMNSVSVFHFDSINATWLPHDVAGAVQHAFAMVALAVNFYPACSEPVQQDDHNCGPWVVEWLRMHLGGVSWTHGLPAIATARNQHREVAGVAEALQRDRESTGCWRTLDFSLQSQSLDILETLCSEDVWRRFLLPLRNPAELKGKTTLLGATRQLLRSGELSLGLLYKRFLDYRGAKQLAEQLFRARIAQIDHRYRATKAAFLKALGANLDDKKPPRPWPDKAARLQHSAPPGKDYQQLTFKLSTTELLDLGLIACIDVTADLTVLDLSAANKVDWLALAVFLTVIRKRFASRWQHQQTTMTHMTVVALPGAGPSCPCFWALNSKDHNGNGTTRILLPLGEETLPDERTQIRALDLTYEQIADLTVTGNVDDADVHSSLQGILDAVFASDHASLGKTFLDLMSGAAKTQQACHDKLAGKNVTLGRMHCVLLRGDGDQAPMQLVHGKVSAGTVLCPAFKGLIRTYHPPKTGPGKKILDFQLTALQVAYYFLGIVVAETRHARGVYVSTIDLFELVHGGFVAPDQLFSDLDGQIEHGWLLPGANFLGRALEQKLKRLAMPLVGSVTRSTTPSQGLPDPQRALRGELKERTWGEELSLDDPSHPVYQVLMKCMFITLLRFLADCSNDAGTALIQVKGEHDAPGTWFPGRDIAPFHIGNDDARSISPCVVSLSELLFGDKGYDHCYELLERARKTFRGSEAQVFCSLFRLKIICHVWTGTGWQRTKLAPAEATVFTTAVSKPVMATIELIEHSQSWRILLPRGMRWEDLRARLRILYTNASISDFARLLERIQKEEGEGNSSEDELKPTHMDSDDNYSDDMYG